MTAEEHLRIRSVGLGRLEEWPHQAEGLTFVFPREGRGRYLTGTVKATLGPGDVLVSNAGSGGKVVASEPAGFSFLSFQLNAEHLLPLFSAQEVALMDPVLARLKSPKVIPEAAPLAKRCHLIIAKLSTEYTLEHRTQLLNLAAIILAEEFREAARKRSGPGAAKDRAAAILSELSPEELLRTSVEELSTRLHCSRRHLSRLFQQHFGFSFAALRMELRLRKAVTLLRNPDAKVLIIAEECGFNHLGLFNTCFKKRFGVTPTQLRQKAAQRQEKQALPEPTKLSCPAQLLKICNSDDVPNGTAAAISQSIQSPPG